MERREFYENCEKIADFHMPRWEELPEIDLYMDQVIAIAEKYLRPITAEGDNLLTQAMINNYVKNGIVPPPIKKRYGREHMARILIICALKHIVGISSIADMINSLLQNESMSDVLDGFADKFEHELATKDAICAFRSGGGRERGKFSHEYRGGKRDKGKFQQTYLGICIRSRSYA